MLYLIGRDLYAIKMLLGSFVMDLCIFFFYPFCILNTFYK